MLPPPPEPHARGTGPAAYQVTVREAIDYFTQIKDLDNLTRAVTRFVEAPDRRAALLDYLRGGPYLPPYLAAVFARLGLTADATADTRRPPSAGDTAPVLLTLAHQPPPDPGAFGRLGDYRLLDILGRGGMGTVYLGEDVRLRRKVAVKTLLPELAADPVARERFLREAEAAARVEHDNIVPIFQVGEEDRVPFLVMPLLKGEPLDKYLARHPHGLPVGEAVRIARDAAAGLAAAHAHDLVHRDVKPGNIWLEGDARRVRVLDFGLVRHRDTGSDLTKTGALVGTPGYMAPEQAGGGHVDHRADLFSLGCVLYELLTGRKAFTGATPLAVLSAVATADPPPPRAVNPAVPADVSAFVMRLMARNRNDRPRDTGKVLDRLTEFHARLTADPWAGRPRRGGWRRAAAVAAGLAALAGLAAGGVYAHRMGWLPAFAGEPGRHDPPPPAAAPEPPAEQVAELRKALADAGPWLGGCTFVVRGGAEVRTGPGDPIPPDVIDVRRYAVGRADGATPPAWTDLLAPLRYATRPREVAFPAYPLRDAEVETLAGLSAAQAIEAIEFGPRCRTTGRGLVALQKLDGLRSLSFEGRNFGDADFRDTLAGLPRLESLALARTAVSGETLRAVAKLPHLKRLTLFLNPELKGDALEHLEDCPALDSLTLDSRPAGEPQPESNFSRLGVRGLKAHRPNCRIVFRGVEITAAGAK